MLTLLLSLNDDVTLQLCQALRIPLQMLSIASFNVSYHFCAFVEFLNFFVIILD